MTKELRIPLSAINKQDFSLLYFDTHCIEQPDKIYKAYILNLCDYYDGSEAEVYPGNYLSGEDKELLDFQISLPAKNNNSGRIIADATETVKIITSGSVCNNGIIIKNTKYLYSPQLLIFYSDDVIYPRCGCLFFEKEIMLTGYSGKTESPWFCSGNSKTITFFIENKSADEITVYIENSPNMRNITKDAQRLKILPNQTSDIIPYKFSKFTRLTAISDIGKISCTVWFQTQLIN